MRRARLLAAISAAALCISMMGNVPMVSMAQEEARAGTEAFASVEAGAETEAASGAEVETGTNAATGTDADADAGIEVPGIADEEEDAAQEAVCEEIFGEESSELTASVTDFEYSDNEDGTVTIKKYTGSGTKAVVPEQIDGKTVTRIWYEAFRNCSSLTSVEIPSGVTSIGDSVFSGCSSLVSVNVNADNVNYKSVNGILYDGDMKTLICYPAGISGAAEIPSGVTRIKYNAFAGCSELTSIEIPTSVTSIGSYAFYGCSSLTDIEIPAGVIYIERDTFEGCSSLTSIKIPSGVTYFGGWAFKGCSGLTSIEIPAGVTYIEDSAFYGCSGLTSIKIPAGVKGIKSGAFYGCSSLTSIEIPSSVTSIGDATFLGCSSLTSIEIPAGVTSIEPYTFYGCRSLTSIEIPAGVTSIGKEAFYGCRSLTSIEIPAGVTSIGQEAFSYCRSLTSIEIPAGVTSIGKEAFFNCSSLTGIEIPSSVTSIGSYAFQKCNNLTIYGMVDSAAEAYVKKENIPFIPLCEESDLSKVTIVADSVTYNGSYQTAKLYVVDGNNRYLLQEGVNYTGTVKRKAAGTTTVTITGKSYYTGETEVSFTVIPLNLKNALEAGDVVLTATDLEYTGRLQQSTVKVTYNGKILKEGTDYTLKGNGRKAVGTSWAVVTGTGNYKGTIKIKYAMKKATQSNMMVYTKDKRAVDVRTQGATIQLVTSRVRDGAKIVYSVEQPNQGITVSSSGKVTIKKGTKPGKYRIKVLAESTPYYKATSKYFTVVVK